MANIFVAQTSGEVGGSDMWYVPWIVIRIEQDATPARIIETLRGVHVDQFLDSNYEVDFSALSNEVSNVLSLEGYTVISVEAAEAVHFES